MPNKKFILQIWKLSRRKTVVAIEKINQLKNKCFTSTP